MSLPFALCVYWEVLNLYPFQVLTSLIEAIHPSSEAAVGEFTTLKPCVACFT